LNCSNKLLNFYYDKLFYVQNIPFTNNFLDYPYEPLSEDILEFYNFLTEP